MPPFLLNAFIYFVQTSTNDVPEILKADCDQLCQLFLFRLSQQRHVLPVMPDLTQDPNQDHISIPHSLFVDFVDQYVSLFMLFFKNRFEDLVSSPIESLSDSRYIEVYKAYSAFHSALYLLDSYCQTNWLNEQEKRFIKPIFYEKQALSCLAAIEVQYYKKILQGYSHVQIAYTNTQFYDLLQSIEQRKTLYFREKSDPRENDFSFIYQSPIEEFKILFKRTIKKADHHALHAFKKLIVDLKNSPEPLEKKGELSFNNKLQNILSQFPRDFFDLSKPFSLIDASRKKLVHLKQSLLDLYWAKCTKEKVRLMRFDSMLSFLMKKLSAAKIFGVCAIQSEYDDWSLKFNLFINNMQLDFSFIEEVKEIRELRETALFSEEILYQYHRQYLNSLPKKEVLYSLAVSGPQSPTIVSNEKNAMTQQTETRVLAPKPKRAALY